MLELTDQKVLLLVGGECLFMLLIYVRGGGWYEFDLCNCMISTCRFVVTSVITDAGLLGLHAGKSVTVYNCSR